MSDYKDFVEFNEDEIQPMIAESRNFLHHIIKVIRENK